MKEENNGTPKNKWSRIFRKKWFFPALYLTLAALLLTVVIWYQNLGNQVKEPEDEQDIAEDYANSPYDQDAETVAEQKEVIKMPVENADQAEIVTKFFDYDADEEDQESALVHYNNRYYQSTGIDIASSDEEEMGVKAALSGKVKEVKEDPLLGNLVEMSHENGVTTYYASLDEVDAEAGEKLEQGDAIGTAGKNIFGKDSGVHVHFELRKDGQAINPEEFFNQPVSKLNSISSDDESDETNDEADSEATKGESEADDGKTDESDEDKATDDDDKATDDEVDEGDDDMEDNDQADEDENDTDQPGMNDDENDDKNDPDQNNPNEEQPDGKDAEGLDDSDGSTSQSSRDSEHA